jgi:hypothetical protein
MPFCPKCGKENPEGSRFCMHCGADLGGYKVEISPKIDVSPSIKVTPTYREPTISSKCAICNEREAVVTCKQCGRKVCNYHFEERWGGGNCTRCAIALCEESARYNEQCAEEWHEDAERERRSGSLWFPSDRDLIKQSLKFYREWKGRAENDRKEAERLKNKLPLELR